MIDLLEPLAELAGVRLVVLVTNDGVPIAVPGRRPETSAFARADAESAADAQAVSTDDDQPEVVRQNSVADERDDPLTDAEALSAFSMGWIDEITRAVGPLSWDGPERVVLRAARGTLVLRRTHNAWLLVLLAGGLRSEDVVLAMEGTTARIERKVRSMGAGEPAPNLQSEAGAEVPAPFPSTASPTPSTDRGGTVADAESADLQHPRG